MKKRKNHPAELKAKVALEAIRDEMTLVELSRKYGTHPTQTGIWKRAAIENMATAFTAPELVSAADVDRLHSVNRQGYAQHDPEKGQAVLENAMIRLASTSRDISFGNTLPVSEWPGT